MMLTFGFLKSGQQQYSLLYYLQNTGPPHPCDIRYSKCGPLVRKCYISFVYVCFI